MIGFGILYAAISCIIQQISESWLF